MLLFKSYDPQSDHSINLNRDGAGAGEGSLCN